MRIAIYGATGSVGRTLLVHMLKGTDLLPGDEIILVGRDDLPNLHKLLAIKTDLLDAFDAGLITLSVCSTLYDLFDVDLFVMAAGATFSERRTRRSDLAEDNLPLFRTVAQAVSEHSPGAFCLIISNPVELAVAVFCRYFKRELVVGIGAQQDSLRFARAVAASIGLPRQAIRASVLGEHGPGMVPLWSSIVLVDGASESIARLEELKLSSSQGDRPELLKGLQNQLMLLISEECFPEAQRMLEEVPPDLRILVEPFLTVTILRSTPNATANATLDCIAALRCGDSRTVHGQVLVEGEFHDLNGVLGAPLALRRSGWTIGAHLPLTSAELDRLRQVSKDIEKDLTEGLIMIEPQPTSGTESLNALTLRPASDTELASVVHLLNRAYRGEGHAAGWTTEAGLIDGDRDNEPDLRSDLAGKPDSRLMVWAPTGTVQACVWLEPASSHRWYLGSFAVDPQLQNKQIGRQLLAASETYVRMHGGRTIDITVIETRATLIAWYERRGYRRTGATVPFPYSKARFGTPRVAELRFTVLSKPMSARLD